MAIAPLYGNPPLPPPIVPPQAGARPRRQSEPVIPRIQPDRVVPPPQDGQPAAAADPARALPDRVVLLQAGQPAAPAAPAPAARGVGAALAPAPTLLGRLGSIFAFGDAPGSEKLLTNLFPPFDEKAIRGRLTATSSSPVRKENCVEQLVNINLRREALLKAISQRFQGFDAGTALVNKKDFVTAFKNAVDMRNLGTFCIQRYRMSTGPLTEKEQNELHKRHEEATTNAHKLDQLESDLYTTLAKAFVGLKPEDVDASFKPTKNKQAESVALKTILSAAMLWSFIYIYNESTTTKATIGVGALVGALGLYKYNFITANDIAEGVNSSTAAAYLAGGLIALTGKYYGMEQETANNIFLGTAGVSGVNLVYNSLPELKTVKEVANKVANQFLNVTRNYFRSPYCSLVTLGLTTAFFRATGSSAPLPIGGAAAGLGHIIASGILAAAEDD